MIFPVYATGYHGKKTVFALLRYTEKPNCGLENDCLLEIFVYP